MRHLYAKLELLPLYESATESVQRVYTSLFQEVQAAAQRCGEDIWLESLRIETSELPLAASSNNAAASIDLAATLDTLTQDAELRNRVTALIAEIAAKLPAGTSVGEAPFGSDLNALFDDARALTLGRATHNPER